MIRIAFKSLVIMILGPASLRSNLLSLGKNGIYPITYINLKFTEGSAYLAYRKIPNSEAIVIDMVYVPEELRGFEFSNKLFALLFENDPSINKLVFDLDQTNRDVFYAHPDLNQISKLQATPIYKSVSKFGFTQIDHISEIQIGTKSNGKMFPHVILSKPVNH